MRTYSRFAHVPEVVARMRAKADKSGVRPSDAGLWQPHALEIRLGRDIVERIVAEYHAGDGCTVLARRYEVSENAVLALLHREGVELRPTGKVTAEDVEEMHRLRQAGWAYRAIGEKFGVTRVAVRRRLDK